MPRKVVPKKLKVIKGTFRNCRANPKEPDYPTELPEMPDCLGETGKKEWKRMSEILLPQGLLSKIDMAALAAYCQSYGNWHDAEKQLNGENRIITTPNGRDVPNPLIGIINKYADHMRKFLIEFGMTPASRSKVSAKKTKKKKDAWAEFG